MGQVSIVHPKARSEDSNGQHDANALVPLIYPQGHGANHARMAGYYSLRRISVAPHQLTALVHCCTTEGDSERRIVELACLLHCYANRRFSVTSGARDECV
jgi:hypothetical protein